MGLFDVEDNVDYIHVYEQAREFIKNRLLGRRYGTLACGLKERLRGIDKPTKPMVVWIEAETSCQYIVYFNENLSMDIIHEFYAEKMSDKTHYMGYGGVWGYINEIYSNPSEFKGTRKIIDMWEIQKCDDVIIEVFVQLLLENVEHNREDIMKEIASCWK